MKLFKLALTSAAFFMGLQANAGYVCTSPNGDAQLKVNNQVTHLGDTVVILESAEEKKYFFGKMSSDGGLFVKKTVSFFNGEGILIINQFPKNCGRGSCTPNDTHTTAKLIIDNEESIFYCNDFFN